MIIVLICTKLNYVYKAKSIWQIAASQKSLFSHQNHQNFTENLIYLFLLFRSLQINQHAIGETIVNPIADGIPRHSLA